ncbi:MAG: hypothetical protein E7457_03240 [Ruminococcaceae bacterium]|nr:hypothetical protein [Oscillospiraceae bacterium]
MREISLFLGLLLWKILAHILEQFLQEKHPRLLKRICLVISILVSIVTLHTSVMLLPPWLRVLSGNAGISLSVADTLFPVFLFALLAWANIFSWRKYWQLRNAQ